MKHLSLCIKAVLAIWIVCSAGIAGALQPRQWKWADVERVVAIGDVHGAHDDLLAILDESDLIDADDRWIGGETHLVMMGDIVDRGPRPRDAYDLLIRLQEEAAAAGGRLHFILGNHEVMNLVGDLRYVSDEDYASFAGKADDAERKRVMRRLMQQVAAANGSVRTLRSKIRNAFPAGYFARRQAFSQEGDYGRWLLDQQVLVVINEVVFVHGGLSSALLDLDAEEVNSIVLGELRSYLEAEAWLLNAGVLPPEISWQGQLSRVQRLTAKDLSARDREEAANMLEMSRGWLFRPDGPLWYRGTVLNPVEEEASTLADVLDHFGATTVVVGHTPTHTGRISTRHKGAVIQVDTGMLTTHYGGQASALELRGDLIFERYPGSTPALLAAQQWERAAGMFADDAEIEHFLATAPVAAIGELGSGSTRPMLVALADNGHRSRAIFKTFDAEAAIGLEGSDATCDQSYAHEVAAYFIDRLFNLGMVPPTVIRTIDGIEGSLQVYVEGAFNEVNRVQENLEPADPSALNWQLDRVRAFDWLILNPERADDDLLYTIHSGVWQVHLIDQSQAFAPPALDAPGIPTGRPKIDDDLAARIDSLDLDELRTLLGDLLEEAELGSLLTRIGQAQRR